MTKSSKKDLLTVIEENKDYILHLFGKQIKINNNNNKI